MSRLRWLAFGGALAAAAFVVVSSRPLPPPEQADVVRFPGPYRDVQPFMEGIYAADRDHDAGVTPEVRAVIVPHHLTASAGIAAGIRALAASAPRRVVLLSPDHFHACPTLLCTVDGVFATPFGDVQVETGAIPAATHLVTADEAVFRKEHGIAAVLPFIAHYLPGTTVTPLVLSQKVPWRPAREELLALLTSVIGEDGTLVVSSDFSHYLPLDAADAADERTAVALLSKDLDAVAALENPSQSDCPGCLWLLASFADRGGFYEPSILRHTNAARIIGDERVPETTSHFTVAWYRSAGLDAGDLAVAGDVTVTRGEPRPLPAAAAAFWDGDGPRVVNLEGPLATRCPPARGPYFFCNPLERWSKLAPLATHWSVENNHMLDLGAAGKRRTAELLAEAGEIPLSSSGAEAGGIRLFALTALINPVPEASSARLGETQAAVLEALAEPRPGLLNVVLVHGGREFSALSTPEEDLLWKRFIDAGADAVVVSHGHVPGDVLFHKGKPIFRGLGNFAFDVQGEPGTEAVKMVRLRKEGGRVLFQSFVGR